MTPTGLSTAFPHSPELRQNNESLFEDVPPLLEVQISSALVLSLEMSQRKTKSALICLSTVLEDIIDRT